MSRVYTGARGPNQEWWVKVKGVHPPLDLFEDLNPRLDLSNHSPSGLSYGYSGSGPAQTALAILADHFNHHPEECLHLGFYSGDNKMSRGEAAAIKYHQQFKAQVIAKLDSEKPWTLTSEDVSKAIKKLKKTRN